MGGLFCGMRLRGLSGGSLRSTTVHCLFVSVWYRWFGVVRGRRTGQTVSEIIWIVKLVMVVYS